MTTNPSRSPRRQGRALTWLAVLLTAALSTGVAGAADHPNVLFIPVDDWNDWVSVFEGNRAITPNIERLAARGMLFRNAHCAAPICNPSREATMTGLRPSTTGIYENGHRSQALYPNPVTVPTYFRQYGYFSAGAGKIYHDHDGANHPSDWDFYFLWNDTTSVSRQFLAWGYGYSYPPDPQPDPRPANPYITDNTKRNFDWAGLDDPLESWPDVMQTDFGMDFLSRNQQEPFFLAIGQFRPHIPWFNPQQFVDMNPLPTDAQLPPYLANDLDDVPPPGQTRALTGASDHWRLMETVESETNYYWKRAMQGYLASISFSDYNIGRLLDALDASPYTNNTIIVLWSDHGYHLGEKDHWHKRTLWERSTHVPMIVVAPGVTTPGSSTDQPVSLLDIYPTLLDLCGLPPKAELEGRSLVPLLQDPSLTNWDHYAITTHQRNNHAVRSKDFRFIQYSDGTEEFYDHRTDPHEWTNLASNVSYTNEIAEHRAQLPTVNRTTTSNPPLNKEEYRYTYNIPETLLISEFMSFNTETITDENGDYSDWIEVLNATSSSVDLGNYALTSDPASPTMWVFPSRMLAPDERVLVFASGKNRTPAAGELHTNFTLPEGGGYLALVNAGDGSVVQEFSHFARQGPDFSLSLAQLFQEKKLVEAGDAVKFHVPTDDTLGPYWNSLYPFDDAGWSDAVLGVGFNDQPVTPVDVPEKASSTFAKQYVATNFLAGDDGWVVAQDNAAGNVFTNDGGYLTYSTVGENGGRRFGQETGGSRWVGNVDDSVSFTVEIRLTVDGNPGGSKDINGCQLWTGNGAEGTLLAINRSGSTLNSGAVTLEDGTVDNETGYQTYRMAYEATNDLFFVWRNQVLLTPNGVGPETSGGKIINRLIIGDGSSSAQSGNVSIEYLRVDLTGAYRPVGTPPIDPPTNINTYIATDISGSVTGVNSSVFLRIPFTFDGNPWEVDSLFLRMRYLDGYRAILNGMPVAEKNAPKPLLWNSAAAATRSAAQAVVQEEVNITTFGVHLHRGNNVLAIQTLNDAMDDGQLLLDAELVYTPSASTVFYKSSTPGTDNDASQPYSPKEVWKEDHFTTEELNNPLISGDRVDLDGDKLPNWLEFGLDTDPWLFTYPPLIPALEELDPGLGAATYFTVSFDTNLNAQDSMGVMVNASPEVERWSPQSLLPTGQALYVAPDVLRHTYRMRDPLDGDSAPHHFVRPVFYPN